MTPSTATNPESFVGRRFWTDFTVEAVNGRLLLLRRAGEIDKFVIDVDEFLGAVEAGFVIEKGAES